MITRVAALTAAVLFLVGCQDSGTFFRSKTLGGNESLLTSADLRTVNRVTPGGRISAGRINPAFVTCAEPSPDVAKAVSSSLSAGGALSVQGIPSGVTPEVAAAVTRARAESVAQLGERLATIQLLRDGLYRACEAYSNGAISDTTYALIVSRFDETMVTMLSTDVAGGAFGRSLAALGGEAAGTSSASADVQEKQRQRREAESSFSDKRAEHRVAKESLSETRKEKRQIESSLNTERTLRGQTAAELAAANASGAPQAEVDELSDKLARSDSRIEELEESLVRSSEEEQRLETELSEATKELQEAEEELKAKVEAQAQSEAKATFQAGGAITRTQDPEVARALAQIQGQFLGDSNLDALMVACISALDRPEPTALSAVCEKLLDKETLLKLIVASKRAE